MSTTASNPWTADGRHKLNLGGSILRAVKTRKGEGAKSNKFDRELYSFRYNFQPESIDVTKPGTIEIRPPIEQGTRSSVTVVRPSIQNEHGVTFIGKEKAAREYECVLVYDETYGTYTLEKMDAYVSLHHDPKAIHTPRYAASPAPAIPPRVSASISSSTSHAQQEPAVKHEEEESEGEIPETKPEPKPRPVPRPVAAPPKGMKLKPSVAAPPPPVSEQSRSARPAPSLPPKPVPSASKANPRASVSDTSGTGKGVKREHPDEETINTAPRAQPVQKKPRVVPEKKEPPPPKSPVELSFPAPSLAVSLPSLPSLPPAHVSQPVPAASAPAPAPPGLPDSDEEEWDDISPPQPPALALAAPAPRIVMEEIDFVAPPSKPSFEPSSEFTENENEGEEIDLDAFEEELKEELDVEVGGSDGLVLDDEDDFLAGAVSPVDKRGPPVSLASFAGGGADFDDDEYSSSDDSDDDD